MSIYHQHTPYTYLIGWSKLNIWYYGRRTAKKCNPDEFWVTYFTSSNKVQNAKNQNRTPKTQPTMLVYSILVSSQGFYFLKYFHIVWHSESQPFS